MYVVSLWRLVFFFFFFLFFFPRRISVRLSVIARTEPNQTEPTEITEPAQPNLRKLTDNYAYRYRVLAPISIRTLMLLTPSSLIIIIIIIRYIIIIIIINWFYWLFIFSIK